MLNKQRRFPRVLWWELNKYDLRTQKDYILSFRLELEHRFHVFCFLAEPDIVFRIYPQTPLILCPINA